MKLLGVIGLILMIISTVSVAQIRYAFSNPSTSLDTIAGIALEGAFLTYLGYRYLSGKNILNLNRRYTYNMIGAKGGKATRTRKRKSNLNHNGKH